MQKIGFNKHYGLQDAVVKYKTKTMTRRIENCLDVLYNAEERLGEPLVINEQKVVNEYLVLTKTNAHILYLKPRYKLGEQVAVAQAYNEIINELPDRIKEYVIGYYADSKAWNNKLYVRPDLMPHLIEITGIRVERLQDISDEDIMKEGITYIAGGGYGVRFGGNYNVFALNPLVAFAALIDCRGIGGPGTWKRNPWVVVYTFKLIK